MPFIPNVNPNELITSAWGNTIRDHVVQRFANGAARTAAIPTPVEGTTTYQADTDAVEVWNGTTWKTVHGGIPLGAGQGALAGTYAGQPVQMRGWLQNVGAAGDGTWAAAFPSAVNGVLAVSIQFLGPYAVIVNPTSVTTSVISGIALNTSTAAPSPGAPPSCFHDSGLVIREDP